MIVKILEILEILDIESPAVHLIHVRISHPVWPLWCKLIKPRKQCRTKCDNREEKAA